MYIILFLTQLFQTAKKQSLCFDNGGGIIETPVSNSFNIPTEVETELRGLKQSWNKTQQLAKDRQKWKNFVAALRASGHNGQ